MPLNNSGTEYPRYLLDIINTQPSKLLHCWGWSDRKRQDVCLSPKLFFSQSECECHIHWPLKRAIACMSSYNPPVFKHTILSESHLISTDRLCSEVMQAFCVGLHLNISTVHFLTAILLTDGNKIGAAAFEDLFKILCDFLYFNGDTLYSWTNIKCQSLHFA